MPDRLEDGSGKLPTASTFRSLIPRLLTFTLACCLVGADSLGVVPAADFARQLNPASRRTALIVSEIMYHPVPEAGTNSLEFIEIFNSDPVALNLSGWSVSGDVDHTFATNTVLPGRGFLVIARDPPHVEAAYGISGVRGPFAGALPDAGGLVRLRDEQGAILLEVNYENEAPWPIQADGAGHSLVLARPDYGQDSVKAWSASAFVGGSPGTGDPSPNDPLLGLVINEFLAHTDLPFTDFVELYNAGTQAMDLSGCTLSDAPDAYKYTLPAGTVLNPGEFASYDQASLGFSLSKNGDDIFLVNSNGTRVIDAVRFAAQVRHQSTGHYPDGTEGYQALTAMTPGTTNAVTRSSSIVINEIMYPPMSGKSADEYIELFNRGTNAVPIGNWRFVDGIDFVIPAGTEIPAGGFMVIANSATNLIARYPQLHSVNCLGNYSGSLSDRGERVALAMPEDPLLPNQGFVTVDEVTYEDGWGQWSDGGGGSLELRDLDSDNRWAMNWSGSDETEKAPWAAFELTGVLGDGPWYADELHILLLDAGECLLDNVEVIKQGGGNLIANPGFESGIAAVDISPGSYTIEFAAVSEWQKPLNQMTEPAPVHGMRGIGVYIQAGPGITIRLR